LALIADCGWCWTLTDEFLFAFTGRALDQATGLQNNDNRWCDTVIRLQPDDAEAYYDRALAYENKGQRDKAMADLDAALRLRPKYPHYL